MACKTWSDPAWFSEYVQFNVESIDVSMLVNGSWAHTKFTKVFENDTTIQGLKDQVQDHLFRLTSSLYRPYCN